ncbi:MAG: hypothetical protein MZV70_75405 [Desulfobacterales bacterium]|nr:hypothetical protein [Desulfobacterales bacterium]
MVPGNFSELAEQVRAGVVNIQVMQKGEAWPDLKDSGEIPSETVNPFGDFFGPFGGRGSNAPRGDSRGWAPGSS